MLDRYLNIEPSQGMEISALAKPVSLASCASNEAETCSINCSQEPQLQG